MTSFSDQIKSNVTSLLHVETAGELTLSESEFQMDVTDVDVTVTRNKDHFCSHSRSYNCKLEHCAPTVHSKVINLICLGWPCTRKSHQPGKCRTSQQPRRTPETRRGGSEATFAGQLVPALVNPGYPSRAAVVC